ncbi:PPA1309 family protein [Timonella sp. A28]|uniref:PPA1309 family protein n=1 Tax=Timonella sp. A28 TaxID=3442640 RepID=UPI003EBCAF1C
MSRPLAQDLTPEQRSLADAVSEIERHVSRGGWDGPVRVFALINTQSALNSDPDLAEQLPPATVQLALTDEHHLTSVEQEELPNVESLEELLGTIAWPHVVAGCAVVAERVVLPPAAESEIPTDPAAALQFVTSHPERNDVRMAVAVLRTGVSWCAIRAKSNDSDTEVAHGPDLVPGLIDAVRSTLEP